MVENITEIDQPSPPKSFAIRPFSRFDENDSLEIITPLDFKFYVTGDEALEFISLILEGGEQLLPDGTRVIIDKDYVYLIDGDPWINAQFKNGDIISSRIRLAYMTLRGYRIFLKK